MPAKRAKKICIFPVINLVINWKINQWRGKRASLAGMMNLNPVGMSKTSDGEIRGSPLYHPAHSKVMNRACGHSANTVSAMTARGANNS